MIKDIKAKLPQKKKVQEEESDDLDLTVESDDETNASGGGDATSSTEINELEDNEVSEDTASNSLVDKLKAKFSPKNKKKSSASDDNTDVGVAGKKKKINPVILIIVVVALAALFLLPEEDEAPVEKAATSFKKPDRKIKKVKVGQDEEKKDEEKKDEEKKDEEKKDEEKKDEEKKDEEKKDEEKKDEEKKDEEKKDEEKKDEEKKDEEKKDEAVTSGTEDITTDVTETDLKTVDTLKDESADKIETSPDTEDGQEAKPVEDGNITEKILEDLEKQVQKDKPKEIKKEYVTPPDYEYKGRGLVYNCAGKHWACVDAPSYKLCEDNFSSVTYLKKKVECHPSNIYESTKGCELMQNRYVSSNQKTDFCK